MGPRRYLFLFKSKIKNPRSLLRPMCFSDWNEGFLLFQYGGRSLKVKAKVCETLDTGSSPVDRP